MSDSFATSWTVALQALCPWNSPGKNTGVGSQPALQWIFLTQGLNPSLLHCRQILYLLSHLFHKILLDKTLKNRCTKWLTFVNYNQLNYNFKFKVC